MLIMNTSDSKGVWTEGVHRRFLTYFISPMLEQDVAGLAIGMVVVPPATEGGLHEHANAQEFWYVIEGSGKMQIGDEIKPIKKGDIVYGPPTVKHQIINDTMDSILKALFILSPDGDEKLIIDQIVNKEL